MIIIIIILIDMKTHKLTKFMKYFVLFFEFLLIGNFNNWIHEEKKKVR